MLGKARGEKKSKVKSRKKKTEETGVASRPIFIINRHDLSRCKTGTKKQFECGTRLGEITSYKLQGKRVCSFNCVNGVNDSWQIKILP